MRERRWISSENSFWVVSHSLRESGSARLYVWANSIVPRPFLLPPWMGLGMRPTDAMMCVSSSLKQSHTTLGLFMTFSPPHYFEMPSHRIVILTSSCVWKQITCLHAMSTVIEEVAIRKYRSDYWLSFHTVTVSCYWFHNRQCAIIIIGDIYSTGIILCGGTCIAWSYQPCSCWALSVISFRRYQGAITAWRWGIRHGRCYGSLVPSRWHSSEINHYGIFVFTCNDVIIFDSRWVVLIKRKLLTRSTGKLLRFFRKWLHSA